MWWFGRVLFKWTEPKQIGLGRAEKLKVYLSIHSILKRTIMFTAMFLTIWFLAWLTPKKSPLSIYVALPICLGGGLFLSWFCVFGPYLFYQRFSGEFKVTKKEIKYKGSGHQAWPFRKISAFELITNDVSAPDYFIQLITNKGRAIQIGGISQKDSDEFVKVLKETIGLDYREQQSESACN